MPALQPAEIATPLISVFELPLFDSSAEKYVLLSTPVSMAGFPIVPSIEIIPTIAL
jgi:hypothetical protein